ncbi:hypothetical protein J4465_01665 [Candidatus Pacearchaeota archaeon]|nr:hypothetical protein [Candidatus Pacearchaeota archaeon]
MKTLGKKLIEWGFLEYKPGMMVCIDNFGTDLYGLVEEITSKSKGDLSTTKTVHIQLDDCVVREDYDSELLRPITLLEKILKANNFSKAKVDSHTYPF